MSDQPDGQAPGAVVDAAATVHTLADLAQLLRQLRRRHARHQGDAELTYRELAARTGWSQAAVWEYLAGRTLPSTDRFDSLVRLLGATPAEQGGLATARDRVEELRRRDGSDADPAGPPGRAVPQQLPPAVRHFVGRLSELDTLTTLVDQAGAGGTVTISSIDGTAGIGKTALAVYWAHSVRERFPDGQLYVNLRGHDPTGRPVGPADAVRGFLEALGVTPQRIPVGLDAQSALYRSLVADRRVLVVLDNARDVEQVLPLLPASSGSLAVVTSRNRLTRLVATLGAHPLTVDRPSAEEARELLARRLGADRVAAEPRAVDDLIAGCARLPLALALVAARATAYPHFPLATLAAELDAAAAGTVASQVRTVFSWSYETLDPTAARLFRYLGMPPGADLGLPAAASLVGLPAGATRTALATLADAHLIDQPYPGRFTCHDLLRDYAAELAHAHDSDDDRRRAARRLLDHYLHTAHAAARLLNPQRRPITPEAAVDGATTGTFTDHAAALAWFRAERAGLLGAVALAADQGFDTHAWQLAWTLTSYFNRQGYGPEWVVAQRIALGAARRLTDPAAEAQAHVGLANAHIALGDFEEAETHYRQALSRYDLLGDLTGQANAHHNLALVVASRGRDGEALRHAQKALDLHRAAGDRAAEAAALNNVACAHSRLGDHGLAVACCEQALALVGGSGSVVEADVLDSLGFAHHHLGDHVQAGAYYRRALDLFREHGDRRNEAATLTNLGASQRAAGDPTAARTAYRGALEILVEMGHPDAGRVRVALDELDARG